MSTAQTDATTLPVMVANGAARRAIMIGIYAPVAERQ